MFLIPVDRYTRIDKKELEHIPKLGVSDNVEVYYYLLESMVLIVMREGNIVSGISYDVQFNEIKNIGDIESANSNLSNAHKAYAKKVLLRIKENPEFVTCVKGETRTDLLALNDLSRITPPEHSNPINGVLRIQYLDQSIFYNINTKTFTLVGKQINWLHRAYMILVLRSFFPETKAVVFRRWFTAGIFGTFFSDLKRTLSDISKGFILTTHHYTVRDHALTLTLSLVLQNKWLRPIVFKLETPSNTYEGLNIKRLYDNALNDIFITKCED